MGVQDGKTAVERAVKRKLNALHDLCGSLACTRGLGPKKLNFSDVFVPKSKPMQRSYVAEARQQSRVGGVNLGSRALMNESRQSRVNE